MGGAGEQIVETRNFWEILWWKHLHMKNMQKTMEKNQTHVPSQASPQTWPMGLSFLFFLFFWFSRGFGQITKNYGKTKKIKNSDPCPQPGLSPDLAHGSELFVFFDFLEVLAKLQKTMEKQKKN